MNPVNPVCARGDILIVNEDPNDLQFLMDILTRQGHQVRGVRNGPCPGA